MRLSAKLFEKYRCWILCLLLDNVYFNDTFTSTSETHSVLNHNCSTFKLPNYQTVIKGRLQLSFVPQYFCRRLCPG